MTDTENHLKWFRSLDRIFWVMWALLPVMIWLGYRTMLESGKPVAGMTPEQQHCFEILPAAGNLSPQGTTVFWAYFAFEYAIYFILLAILHRMVHRFAKGRILVSDTLINLQVMGVVLIVWPFLEVIAANLAGYLWKQTGDMPAWITTYNFDLAPIAVGVFLIALKGVLEHAIALKAENDLTI